MKKNSIFIITSILIEVLIIVSISIANAFNEIGFFIFYNGIYGLILSILFPICYTIKNKEGYRALGIKKIGIRQVIVLVIFMTFSVAGQIVPKIVKGELLNWDLIPICIFPLIMTTFFEEFLFRGFFQTRMEEKFGSIIAIIVSAIMFSFYHLGYPGFRTFQDTLLLFVVGMGFAIGYKLSDNNLIISYFINLPNAFITYILKSEQFPQFTITTSAYAIVSIIIIIFIFIMKNKKIVLTYKEI